MWIRGCRGGIIRKGVQGRHPCLEEVSASSAHTPSLTAAPLTSSHWKSSACFRNGPDSPPRTINRKLVENVYTCRKHTLTEYPESKMVFI